MSVAATAWVAFASLSHAQLSYTTTWVANSFGGSTTYVGNAARSMWVAPEGVVYTASMWDESEGSINIYQNGQKTGALGAHGETQGGAIGGDAADLFAALQYNSTLGGSGYIGRYNRSTGLRDLTWSASSDTTERRADVITGIADTGALVYVSDHPDNLVRCYTTAGVWQSDWPLTDPGSIAVDGSGNVWVAQMSEGTIHEFSPSGQALATISMGSSARPSALYYDAANNQLMVGDQGPNMNVQIYGSLAGTPVLAGSFGVQGGYLDSTTGVKGQTGDKRFTRIVGLGKDSAGNLYVLCNPWGGTWDLGRNGKTDIYCYSSAGALQYRLQGLNFEGNAAFDPGTNGAYLYSGQDVYTGSGGGGYAGNSVDLLDNPTDPRGDVTNNSRGFDFGVMTSVGGHRILAACGQNPDIFLFSYFDGNGYRSIPFGTLPGQTSPAGYTNYFNTTARVRNGFCLATNGDIWVGLDKTNAITHYPLSGFDANGVPLYGTPTTTPTPSTIAPLGGIEYIPSTDTMVLMNALTTGTGSVDWTSLGGRVEVYHGWMAGNTTTPNLVITLKTSQNPKGRAAAGNYLFISYVHTVPDIDAYNLTTGADDLTMTSADTNVAVGNDVDSMYGIRAMEMSNGQYLISKDNYNNNSVVIHTMTVGSQPPPPAPTGLVATSTSSSQINLSWTMSPGATTYDVLRSPVSGGPYTSIATGVTSTAYSDTGLTASTTYYYVVQAVNGYGTSADSNEASATTSGGTGLPTPWQTSDVGAVGIAGSASWSNGTFTVSGSGTSISGTADEFRYVDQTAGTSCTITARVVSMTNTNSGAQAGVMIRESLGTGSTMADVNLTPANGVTWVYRTATNAGTSGSRTAGLVAPYWIRLVRSGSTFTGYSSADGVTWAQQGTVTISMASNAYVGLVVSSRTNSALCTATFDNVSVTSP